MSPRRLAFLLLIASVAPQLRVSAQQQEALFSVDDMLDVVTVSPAALSRDGRWLVVTATTARDRLGVDSHRYGDPTYIAPARALVWVTDTRSGQRTPLFAEKQQATAFEWAPDGGRLALLRRDTEGYQPMIWDRATGRFTVIELPDGARVDRSSPLRWSASGDQLFLSVRTREWADSARQRFQSLTAAPIVVLSSENPFLAWESLRRMSQRRALLAWELESGTTRELLPESDLIAVRHSRDGRYTIVTEDRTEETDYDTIGGTLSRIRAVPVDGGEARTLRDEVEGSSRGPRMVWSRDNAHFAWAEKDRLFFSSVDADEATPLTGDDEKTDAADPEESEEPSDEEEEPETFRPLALSPDGSVLAASSRRGIWLIDTADGSRTLIIEQDEEDDDAPSYRALDWGPDSLYFSYQSRTEWDRGFVRYDLETGGLKELIRNQRLYRGFRISEDGSTIIFQSAEGNRPYDIYSTDADFSELQRLTRANPGLDGRLGRTELLTYLDVDGKKTHGVLYYPLDYRNGQRYPTVFNIYERYFDDTYNGTIAVLNAHGYAVVRPTVNFERGYPGEAWVKGVTAAANKVIEMGVADPDRLGVHGTSYGGYATNLLIAQTDRFKAAINISGKVNMVSFYTDSPRLGVRNIHAPENSQDRIGATLWEQPHKYIAHSAVMFADRIKTPLLLITGEQDHNVPARQALEMYYALRRLGRDVEWVSYTNGGHGMPRTNAAEVHDYHRRILQWYERHLNTDESAGEVTDEGSQQPGR